MVGSAISAPTARFTSPPSAYQCGGIDAPPSTWFLKSAAAAALSEDLRSGVTVSHSSESLCTRTLLAFGVRISLLRFFTVASSAFFRVTSHTNARSNAWRSSSPNRN